ncbi:MAG: hypothetical protein UW65_C0042G0001, partial [candidate division WWE3 bacterium GW2011_GWB1_44_4]
MWQPAHIYVENNDVAVGTNVDTVNFGGDFLVSADPLTQANVSIANDALNFTEFSDSLVLDATTSIDMDTNSANFIFDGGSLYIGYTGNVGIGTTAPGAKLEVAGQVKITGGTPGANKVLTSDVDGLATWQSLSVLESVSSVSNSDGTLTISPTTGNIIASLNLGNANTWTGVQSLTANTYFPGSGIWNTSGNVGIGTTAPGQKLDIAGALRLGANGGANDVLNTASGSAPSGDLYWGSRTVCDSSGNCSGTGAGIGGSGTTSYIPRFASTYNLEDSVIYNGGANVGIGITSPASLLDVNGTTWLRGAAGGTSGLFVNSSGNVGIGTTTPSNNLHIANTADAAIFLQADTDNATESDNPFIKLSQDGGAVQGIFGLVGDAGRDPEHVAYTGTLGNSILIGGQTSLEAIHFGTNDTVRMTVDTSGNVGIGTTAPTYLLSVGSTSQFGVNSSGIALLPDGAVGTPALSFTGDTNTGLYRIGADKIGLITGGVATQGVTIDSSGNVGIGTTGPSYKLSVSGGGQFTSGVKLDGYATGLGGAGYSQNAIYRYTTDGSTAVRAPSVGGLRLGGNDIESNPWMMFAPNSGNVGIGTTSPSEKLDIAGALRLGANGGANDVLNTASG